MGERGRRAVEERFNWATSARALLDVYRRLVS
jgi:glycosyltransferase involved in cell wall biosynthesis